MKSRLLKIFIADADLWYGSMLQHHLSLNPDFQVQRFENARELFQHLQQQPDVVLVDCALPDGDAVHVLQRLKADCPAAEVVILSEKEDVRQAVEALKTGASDYVVKGPDTADRLWKVVHSMKDLQGVRKLAGDTKKSTVSQEIKQTLLGNSTAIRKVASLIEKASGSTINVSITGETGTGKEMVAKSIHQQSARASKPFVAVNLAAIPHDLLESELFGYEKGAFTGATQRRIGKFEEAHNGTLFLDEIGELEMGLQAKLLRVLQEREFSRVGSNQLIPLDVRIITATHKDLQVEVQAKRFREDLYYRLMGMPIHMPALRERGEDVLLLARQFMRQRCEVEEIALKAFSLDAEQALLQYAFPGNVRELRSLVELAVVMAEGEAILPPHLHIPLKPALQQTKVCMTLKEYEIQIVQAALDQCEGDVLEAASLLDIGKSTIYRMIQSGSVRTIQGKRETLTTMVSL